MAIIGLSVASGIVYHQTQYGDLGPVTSFASAGVLAALSYVVPGLYRDEYLIQGFLARGRRPSRVVVLWNTAFLFLAVVAFVTKTTGEASRGWAAIFYISGMIVLTGLEFGICRALDAGLKSGRIATRRALVVGSGEELRRFLAQAAGKPDLEVDGTLELPHSIPGLTREEMRAALAAAVENGAAKARMLGVDLVVLLPSCDEPDRLDACMDGFNQLPVAIQLAMRDPMQRCSALRVSHVAGRVSLSLTDPPLSPWQELLKRLFDIVGASVALVLLAPLFAVVAYLIKRDSKGPVFFLQRRRGFNHREFRIWKFRTMTTMDDGEVIVQSQGSSDLRVTKVGHYLRRLNIDELPQLINVLRGEMSLVGPRPHAVAHDKLYETRIEKYPRRLNMRPGITGWAQVNGFRGVTDTECKMRGRVDRDVYYIENWSIMFDIYIIALTVLSPKAYRNAG
jgi:Undecaprenyl-phosphate glucose phosphotransferase